MKNRVTALLLMLILVLTQTGLFSVSAANDKEYVWNLNEFFSSESDFTAKFKEVVADINSLKLFKGKINLDDQHLKFIKANEKIIKNAENILYYGMLMKNKDVTNSKAIEYTNLGYQLFSFYESNANFYYNEIRELSNAKLEELINNSSFAEYKSLFGRVLESKKTRPNDLKEYELGYSDGYSDMYSILRPQMEVDDIYTTLTMGELDYETIVTPDGKSVVVDNSTMGDLIKKYQDSGFRKKVYEAYMSSYTSKRNTLAAIYNKQVSAKALDAKLMGIDSSIEKAFGDYDLTEKAYSELSHQTDLFLDQSKRLNTIVANLAGKSMIHEYDKTISFYIKPPEKTYTMEQAKTEIMEALAPLGTEYVSYIKKAFDEGWIDAVPSKGKVSGAYTMNAQNHPYILTNFYGTVNDIDTLAHELGHAINMYYMNKAQYRIDRNQSLAATEGAASVNEYLFYMYKYKTATTDSEKLYYLYQVSNTIDGLTFNQMMYSEFEEATHKYVEDGGVLTADKLDEMWAIVIDKYENSSKYSVETTVKTGWAVIPHFYNDFYVMNYAFAGTIGNYVIDQLLLGKDPKWYINFLSSGSSKDGMTTIKDLGVDLESRTPYQSIYNKYKKIIDEIETLLNNTKGETQGPEVITNKEIKVNINGIVSNLGQTTILGKDNSVKINLIELANQLGFKSEIFNVENYEYITQPIVYRDKASGKDISENEKQEKIVYKNGIKLTKDNKTMFFVEGSSEVMINGNVILLDNPLVLENGIYSVSIKTIADTFNADMQYNPQENVITINTK